MLKGRARIDLSRQEQPIFIVQSIVQILSKYCQQLKRKYWLSYASKSWKFPGNNNIGFNLNTIEIQKYILSLVVNIVTKKKK